MAKPYRTRSTKGPGGTVKYTTQSPNSKVKTTISYKTGSSTRTAITRNGDGSVVQRKTHKTPDGYVTRTTKTITPKYKHPKAKKFKMPVLKPVKASKPAKIKIPKAPKISNRSTSFRRKSSNNNSPLIWIVLFMIFISSLSMCNGG